MIFPIDDLRQEGYSDAPCGGAYPAKHDLPPRRCAVLRPNALSTRIDHGTDLDLKNHRSIFFCIMEMMWSL